jgi:outer membrane protein TolC
MFFWGGWEATAQEQVLTLEQAVTTALVSSLDLRDARMGLEVAEEQVSEAWSLLYPTIDASAGYTRNLSVASNFLPAVIFDPSADPAELIPVRFGSDNIWTTSINVEQPLFKPEVFVGVGAASRFKKFERENVRGRTQAVVTRVRVSYYSLLLAQEQARLVQKSVDRVRQSLTETKALNKAGLASDYDVLRLEVELANLEPNLRRARNAVSQSERELGIELGLESGDQIRVAGSLAEIDLDDRAANSPANRQILDFSAWVDEEGVDPAGLQSMAQNDRSDLRSLDLMEQLRQTEMKLEQVQYLPEIVVFGTYAITAQENGSPDFFGEPSMRAYARQAGVRVTWPLFSGFSKDARIDQKRASLRQAQAQTRLARSRAENEVETIWDQVGEARERADGQRLAVRQALRGFEIASAQYREGLGSQLELTDSEVALRQSEFNYAQAVYDFLVAQANLDQAVGFVPLVDSNDASGPVE